MISYHETVKANARSVASRSSGVSVSGSYQVVYITMPIEPFCSLCKLNANQDEV